MRNRQSNANKSAVIANKSAASADEVAVAANESAVAAVNKSAVATNKSAVNVGSQGSGTASSIPNSQEFILIPNCFFALFLHFPDLDL